MGSKGISIGIDVGSITVKAAAMEDGKLLATQVASTGYNPSEAAKRIYERLLSGLGAKDSLVCGIVATGYGRRSVSFAQRVVTEITCHGKGADFQYPGVRTVIDIGGQDSKAISLDGSGRVQDFAMNDKCAAGTGRFLEVMAKALEVELDLFGKVSLQAPSPSSISSLCTVFAESEVISLIAKGESRDNIIAGIHEAIGTRIASMIERIAVQEPVLMTGGVAKNQGVLETLRKKLGVEIIVPKHPQENGAIGAAIVAAEMR